MNRVSHFWFVGQWSLPQLGPSGETTVNPAVRRQTDGCLARQLSRARDDG
jgi:hypothetical protein